MNNTLSVASVDLTSPNKTSTGRVKKFSERIIGDRSKATNETNNCDDISGANKISTPVSNHFETYMKIQNLNLFYGSIVGLKPDSMWKYNNLTRWTKFMLIFGTSIAIYSNLLVISKPKKLIEVFSLFAIIAPAFEKFNLFVKTNPNVMAFFRFLEKLFKDNAAGPRAHVLKTHVDGTFASIKIFLPVQTFALGIFICYPIYGYVANNELIQIMPMQFPFIDQSTTGGFIVANLIMMKMGVWAYFGSVGFDLFLARMIDNYCALVKLLQQDIVEFTEMFEKNSVYSSEYRMAFFRNFLLRCQDKDRFMQHINDGYADVIFKQFAVVYVCLNFTVYAIIRSKWYSGYGILVFCLVEMYILCILGTAIKTEILDPQPETQTNNNKLKKLHRRLRAFIIEMTMKFVQIISSEVIQIMPRNFKSSKNLISIVIYVSVLDVDAE